MKEIKDSLIKIAFDFIEGYPCESLCSDCELSEVVESLGVSYCDILVAIGKQDSNY